MIVSWSGLLVLTAASGVAALVGLGRLRESAATLHTRFRDRSAALERVRGGIYLSGTLARDYFLDPAAADAAAVLARLSGLEQDTRAAASSSGAALEGEVTTYWRVLDLMLAMAGRRHTAGVDSYFRRQLGQRGDTMLQIAAEIGAALDQEWRRGDTAITSTYRRWRNVLAAELAVVVVLGILLAVGTTRRLVKFETESRALRAQLVSAQEEERRTISRELHDEVGQALSTLMLDVAKTAAAAESRGARARLAGIATTVDRTIEAVRRIALSLRPSMLDDLGLVAALEWQAREVARSTGLDVQVRAEEKAGELPDESRTCIYRVTQEALHNCSRHAKATRAVVTLERTVGRVQLRVADNGNGFRTERTRGLGLLGMEERVTELGGSLRVESQPGSGTTLTAELPA